MAEYTYDNILIDPSKEGIESLIGKEVYFSDIPHICLENANLNDFHYLGILEQIRKDGNAPFKVKGILSTSYWSCIIEKKEEPKPKYVPFEDGREFLKSYTIVESCLISENFFLSHHGIWLKHRESDDLFMVVEIWDDGVVIGGNQFTTSWNDLSNNYTFLDGSPCGKEVEE